MARTVRDAKLDSRAARQRLKPRHRPYWRVLEAGRHVGYYRGAAGGSWLARRYLGGGKYEEATLGPADDVLDVDAGGSGMTFSEAQAKAREWFTAAAATDGDGAGARGYTVRRAIGDYLDHYASGQTRGGGRALHATRQIAARHVLTSLGELLVSDLKASTIRTWLKRLAESPARTRSGKARNRSPEHGIDEAEVMRRRRATANRTLTVLKAALNHAFRDNKASSDSAWRKVQPFRGVDLPRVRSLDASECARLVNATETDFRPMVRAGLLTGLRYGELTALRVADVNDGSGTLNVRTSKSGKPRHVVLTDEARVLLVNACRGKDSSALVFTRPDGGAWGKSHQARRLISASKAAHIEPAVTFHILRHTHGSLLAMRGVPMRVIADQLGHADTRMTERHYAHLAPSYVAATIRANFPTLGIVPESNVTEIDEARAKRST